MSNRLPKQSDLDSELWPALNAYSPTSLAMRLGCYASLLLATIAWLALLGVMTAGWVPWVFWPFVVLPVALWLALLALPALFALRRGTLAILDAIAMTAEAWLARAGYSIDLNNDGYIGHIRPVQMQPPQTEVTRPIPWRVAGETKLLANEQPDAIGASANVPEMPPERIERRLWECPNGFKVPVETLEQFVTDIFDGLKSHSRGDWVASGIIDREVYDALILQLEQAKLLEGRKTGYAGKLTVDNSRRAKMVLGLLPRPAAPAPPPDDTQDPLDEGRYEHI